MLQNMFLGKELEECDRSPSYTYFEKQCGQLNTLDVRIAKINECACNKRCNPHPKLVSTNSIILSSSRNGRMQFHLVHNSCMNLDLF